MGIAPADQLPYGSGVVASYTQSSSWPQYQIVNYQSFDHLSAVIKKCDFPDNLVAGQFDPQLSAHLRNRLTFLCMTFTLADVIDKIYPPNELRLNSWTISSQKGPHLFSDGSIYSNKLFDGLWIRDV